MPTFMRPAEQQLEMEQLVRQSEQQPEQQPMSMPTYMSQPPESAQEPQPLTQAEQEPQPLTQGEQEPQPQFQPEPPPLAQPIPTFSHQPYEPSSLPQQDEPAWFVSQPTLPPQQQQTVLEPKPFVAKPRHYDYQPETDSSAIEAQPSSYVAAIKKNMALILVVSLGVLAVIALIISAAIPKRVENVAAQDYYFMGEDKVPSVKLIIGQRDIGSFSENALGGASKQIIKYNVTETPSEEISLYGKALTEDYSYLDISGIAFDGLTGSESLYAKESVDETKLIIVQIDHDSKGYTLTLYKVDRELVDDYLQRKEFAIVPATSWEIINSAEYIGYESLTAATNTAELFLYTIQRNNPSQAKHYLDVAFEMIKRQYPGGVFGAVTNSTVNGFPAIEFTFTHTIDNAYYKQKEIFLYYGTCVYNIKCRASADQWAAAEDDFQIMINSFALK